ncbi:hypothetical protein Trydic_g21498 [Trypoxylus dichotomus]
MANIKGSFPQDDFLKNHPHGLVFNYPPKAIKTTAETLITTTTEIAQHVKDTIKEIFTDTGDETDILTSNNDVQNGTSIDINLGSNATSTSNNITDIFNTGSNNTGLVQNPTEGVKVVVDTMRTTTANVIDYFTSTVSDISTTIEDGNISQQDMHTNNPKTYHIIIIVLVIILFIIGLGLFSIYMYYKKRNMAHITGHYQTQGSREIATSSERNPNDTVIVHQQSAC